LAALSAARGAGAFSVAANSAWRQRRLMVLCYHGVSVRDEHEWSSLYVSQDHLRRRLQRLRELDCNLLPLGEALERQRAGELPPRAVSITFDDGAADFHTRAYPVLQEFGAPAMLYQSTWYVDRPYPVFNTAASYVLWQARGREVTLPWQATRVRIPATSDAVGFRSLHTELRRFVAKHHMCANQQNALLDEIAKQCLVDLGPLFEHRILHLLQSAELRALDPALVDIQLHTHRHRTPLERSLFMREIDDNVAALRGFLQRDLTLEHFCYPSGHYRAEHTRWLREWGMRSATTCDPGMVEPETDPLLIPRLIDSAHLPDTTFEGWVTGLAALLPARRATPVQDFSGSTAAVTPTSVENS
jgi:peptidoglycan/xylan/chitin deacetylase (PgdA/CDA1 family)